MSKVERRYVLTVITDSDAEDEPSAQVLESVGDGIKARLQRAYIAVDEVHIEPYEGYPHSSTEESPAAP